MPVLFDAEAIARATGGNVLRDAGWGPILTDTRADLAGAWFLALSGARFDGHAFVDEALARGALGAIVSRPVEGRGGAVVVGETERALQDLGHAARLDFPGIVVGITGSSGKTTTRAFVSLAISGLGPVHQTVGNLNNHLGVPMTLLACPDEVAAQVVEMGTSAPGEIRRLCEIAVPDVRLLVNVGPAHLEELGGLDGVAREKGEIFATARPDDVICVNLDDPRVAALPTPPGVRRLTFGSAASDVSVMDVRLREAVLDPETLVTRCRWGTRNGEITAVLPAPGAHLALNATGALCVAEALDLDLADAARALERYEPVGMRMRAEPLPHGAIALNDAYNANPQSTEASLRLLASLPGKRTAVLGDMLELGSGEADWHAKIAQLAASLGLDRVILFGPRMVAAAHHCPGARATVDPDEAARIVGDGLVAGERVLFKGSRGARVERVLNTLRGDPPSGAH